ncbi:MAG: hypothetical protein NC901_02835 [Candidatus Omnitrophica bacterium]|nr:hypothetical protein [Candidatus Omnitrophota bacterium]
MSLIKVSITSPEEIKINLSESIDLSGVFWIEPPRLMQIKMIDDFTVLNERNGYIIVCVPQDLDNYKVKEIEAYVTTPSQNGNIVINVKNITKNLNILNQNIIIEPGKYTSYQSQNRPEINENNNIVNVGDLIEIKTLSFGENAKGLGIILKFGR